MFCQYSHDSSHDTANICVDRYHSKMTNKKLSIIIVTYNSEDLIMDCLYSIFKYNDIGDSLEIIIVDNSPASNVIFSIIKKTYSEEIKLISSGNNDGFGRGNNTGVAASESEHILFFNHDARLVFPIFKSALSIFENSKYVSMIGPKEVDENLNNTTSFYYRMEYQNLLRTLLLQKIFNKMDLFIQSKMYINGACFFVNKSTFIKAGGFDENISLYAEEPDLITRIENTTNNSKCLYVPQLKIIHLKKRRYNSYETLKYTVDSAVYYLKKHKYRWRLYLKRRLLYSKIKYYSTNILGKTAEALVYKNIIMYINNLEEISNEK